MARLKSLRGCVLAQTIPNLGYTSKDRRGSETGVRSTASAYASTRTNRADSGEAASPCRCAANASPRCVKRNGDEIGGSKASDSRDAVTPCADEAGKRPGGQEGEAPKPAKPPAIHFAEVLDDADA